MSLIILVATISLVYGSPSLNIDAGNSENNFQIGFGADDDTKPKKNASSGQEMKQIQQLISKYNVLSEENAKFRQELNQTASEFDEQLEDTQEALEKSAIAARDCLQVYQNGYKTPGVYTIYIGLFPVRVSCEYGYIIMQRRSDGSTNFRRDFKSYENGFGDPNAEYWLGLQNIYQLTSEGNWLLRVDLTTFSGESAFREYRQFKLDVGPEYALRVGTTGGTAGDAFASAIGNTFSTYDRDESGNNCAADGGRNGAWWWSGASCGDANLNGYTYNDARPNKGMYWSPWKGVNTAMKTTVMKIRKLS